MQLLQPILLHCESNGVSRKRQIEVKRGSCLIEDEHNYQFTIEDYRVRVKLPNGAASILGCDLPCVIDMIEWNNNVPTEFHISNDVALRFLSLVVQGMNLVDRAYMDENYNTSVMYNTNSKYIQIFVSGVGYLFDHVSIQRVIKDSNSLLKSGHIVSAPQPQLIIHDDSSDICLKNVVDVIPDELPIPIILDEGEAVVQVTVTDVNCELPNIPYGCEFRSPQLDTGFVSIPCVDLRNGSSVLIPTLSYYDIITMLNSTHKQFVEKMIEGKIEIWIDRHVNGVKVRTSGFVELFVFIPCVIDMPSTIFISFAVIISTYYFVVGPRYITTYPHTCMSDNGDRFLIWACSAWSKPLRFSKNYEVFDVLQVKPVGFYRNSITSLVVRTNMIRMHNANFFIWDLDFFNEYIGIDRSFPLLVWNPLMFGQLTPCDPKSNVNRVGGIVSDCSGFCCSGNNSEYLRDFLYTTVSKALANTTHQTIIVNYAKYCDQLVHMKQQFDRGNYFIPNDLAVFHEDILNGKECFPPTDCEDCSVFSEIMEPVLKYCKTPFISWHNGAKDFSLYWPNKIIMTMRKSEKLFLISIVGCRHVAGKGENYLRDAELLLRKCYWLQFCRSK